MNVKIFGAGSIGNHLAYAARRAGWEVCVVDPDPQALARMRDSVYPSRYGSWDETIRLCAPQEASRGGFDVIFLGTPPDVRLGLVMDALKEEPRLLQLEKPLGPPLLEAIPEFVRAIQRSQTIVCVGYEHVVSESIAVTEQILCSGQLGRPETLDAEFRVHWGDIFLAHPWLSGPKDSYLGQWRRGGGASGEHSHAINLWQHISHLIGQGRVTEVSAALQYVRDRDVDYDALCFINLTTETGFTGRVVQDVVTKPHRQVVRYQGSDGFLEWYVRWNADGDMVRSQKESEDVRDQLIRKKRSDDFYREILHFQDLLGGTKRPEESPMSIWRGLDTLLVITACHLSTREKTTVRIDYTHEYGPGSLVLAA